VAYEGRRRGVRRKPIERIGHMGLISSVWARAAEPLRRRLRSAARVPKRFQPDLSERGFFARLAATSPALRAAQQRWAEGDIDAARREVVNHFLQRQAPRFFVAPEAVGGLAQRLRQDHRPWVDAVCARVHEESISGLRLMSRRHSPLGPGFCWIDIPPGPGDDSLYSAQPHRFGFLPRLTLAAHHGLATLPAVESLLAGWIGAAEQGEPECYHSPLAVLYRGLALSWAWAFVAGLERDTPSRERVLFDMLRILSVDIVYLAPTIGQSYPNNHLLADGFAGWYVGTLYPEMALAADCKARGEPLFVAELQRQFFADGSNFEHSTHYHELGCEMAAAYVLLSRGNGVEPAAAVLQRLRAMLHFQAALGGREALPLVMGDSTDDPLFPLDVEHGWANGALRELYRALFDATLPSAPPAYCDVERAFWLLGGTLAPPPGDDACDEVEAALHFEQGGVHVWRDDVAQARLIFRAGPVPGCAISAGHANADLHSVFLNVGGRRLIVGAGTYSYRFPRPLRDAPGPDWRSYFAGPNAHNGLIGAGDPFGEMAGDFRNREVDGRVVLRRGLRGPGLAWIESEVIGGARHRGHRRGVVHVHGEYWLVYDVLPASLRAAAPSIALQFDADVTLARQPDGRAFDAVVQDSRCRIALSAGLQPAEVLEGSLVPHGGWIAPRYGQLVAAPQLRARFAGPDRPPAFVIQPAPKGRGCVIVDASVDDGQLCWRIADDDQIDELRVTLNEAPASAAASPALVWRRMADTTEIERRQLGQQAT
jgi:hypothetical protein